MKPLFLVIALLALCISSAQAQTTIPQTFVCEPQFPVTPFDNYFSTSLVTLSWSVYDAGVVYDNGIKLWHNAINTAHIYSFGPNGFTVDTIPGNGMGMMAWNNHMGQVFSLNGVLYFADSYGIRQNGTFQSWSYPSVYERYILSATEVNNAMWLTTSDYYNGTVHSVIRFDGNNITEISSPHGQLISTLPFVIGNDLYFNSIADSLVAFNTISQTFTTFNPAAYPNWANMYPQFGRNGDGNIVATFFNGSSVLIQEFDGSAWGALSTLPVSGISNTLQQRVVNYGDNLVILLGNDSVGQLLVAKKSLGQYVQLETAPTWFSWQAASLFAKDQDDNLYLFTPDFLNSGVTCGNTNTLWLKFLNSDSLYAGSGKLYVDANTNGSYDAADYPIAGHLVCNTNTSCVSSNTTGDFGLLITNGTNVITPPAVPYFIATPASHTLNNVAGDQSGLDFVYQPTTAISDLAVNSVFSLQPPRPGFTIDYRLTAGNTGTTPVSGTASLTFDSDFTFVSATPSPAFQNGNTIGWATGSINPFQSGEFQVTLSLSTATPIGKKVLMSALVEATPDGNTSNNSYALEQVVQGSFDPNDKAANPEYWVQDGEDIQYTIRFQNTGTDTAFNVVVRDTLDEDLDWSTFSLRYASHPVQIELNPQNGALAFNFNNILLADSNVNEPASHGIFVYSVKTKNGLVDGTPVNNVASIYFDFNAPVVTNPTFNVIGDPNRIEEAESGVLSVYPNPASQVLNVRYNGSGSPLSFVVKDLVGRTVESGTAATDLKLDVSALANGAYSLELLDRTSTLARVRFAVVR